MLVLGIDSSAGPASAALVEDGRLLGEFYIHTKQTHSQTLLPMVQELLACAGRSCGDLEGIAVSHGPGSFTGVRIGVACAKGIAFAGGFPCAGVSTLEAIAFGGARGGGGGPLRRDGRPLRPGVQRPVPSGKWRPAPPD